MSNEEMATQPNAEEPRVRSRRPEMEKAFAMMKKYVMGADLRPGETVEFYQEQDMGITVCRVYSPGDIPSYGVSKIREGEGWNPLIGKYIAMKKARRGRIPKTILDGLGWHKNYKVTTSV